MCEKYPRLSFELNLGFKRCYFPTKRSCVIWMDNLMNSLQGKRTGYHFEGFLG